jgi:hypothetical protein
MHQGLLGRTVSAELARAATRITLGDTNLAVFSSNHVEITQLEFSYSNQQHTLFTGEN